MAGKKMRTHKRKWNSISTEDEEPENCYHACISLHRLLSTKCSISAMKGCMKEAKDGNVILSKKPKRKKLLFVAHSICTLFLNSKMNQTALVRKNFNY
ncbi:hypothetical protein AAHA92_19340 [Salvia divinorum]|uniref:Uncharacterized protein n=1 Tax=Salvia divinorum TaxID=28513 RepID=A0ABD1H987_SALDI